MKQKKIMRSFSPPNLSRLLTFPTRLALGAAVLGAAVIANHASALECSSKAYRAREMHVFPDVGYWMQFGGGRYITHTSFGGTYSQLYDTVERKALPVTRNWDATILPEGDLYVHSDGGHAVTFHKVSDALRLGEQTPAIHREPQQGAYQSVGSLSTSGNTREIRILTGQNHGMIRDYKVEKNGEEYAIAPTGPLVQACGNVITSRERNEPAVQMPILSKDGKMVSYRHGDGRTSIYRLAMPSGSCTLAAEIPTKTDKVQFSPDGKKVLFSQVPEDEDSADLESKQLYELDVATGKKTRISAPGETVLYHAYKPDGSIMYTRTPPTRDGKKSELIMLDKDSVPMSGSAQAKPLEAIGRIWLGACGLPVSEDGALAAGSRIDRSKCRDTITDAAIAQLPEGFRALSKDQLLNACGSTGAGSAGTGSRQ